MDKVQKKEMNKCRMEHEVSILQRPFSAMKFLHNVQYIPREGTAKQDFVTGTVEEQHDFLSNTLYQCPVRVFTALCFRATIVGNIELGGEKYVC